MKKFILILLTITIYFGLSAQYDCPPEGMPHHQHGGMDGDFMAESREDFMYWRLISELELSDEQMPVVFKSIKEMRVEAKAFHKSRRELFELLEAELQSDNIDEMKAESAMNKLDELERNFFDKKEEYKSKIVKILNPRQKIIYYLFKTRFKKDVQNFMKNRFKEK